MSPSSQGLSPPSYQTGTEESPLLTVPTLRHDIVSGPLQAYFQTHYDKKGESGSYSPLPPAWACGLSTQSRGFTWLLGSQGTERGISACLQDTMYFLEEGRRQSWSLESFLHGRKGPMSFRRLLSLCSAQTPVWPGRQAGHTENRS